MEINRAVHLLVMPYYLTVGLLFAVGIMTASLFGEKFTEFVDNHLRMFFWGKFSEMSEEVARNLADRSQAMRGKGFFDNLIYNYCNNHILLAIFFCEPHHPYAPFKRIVIFFAISVYSFCGSMIKDYILPSSFSKDVILFTDFLWDIVVISLPSMMFEGWLQYGVLWYSHQNVVNLLEAKKRERVDRYLEELIDESKLRALDNPKTYHQVAYKFSKKRSERLLEDLCTFVYNLLYRLLQAIYRFCKAFYEAEMLFVKYGSNELVSTIVVGCTFQVSVAALIVALQFDHKGAIVNFIIGLALNIVFFSLISMYCSFRLQWILEHPTTSQSGIDGLLLRIQNVIRFLTCRKESIALDEPQQEMLDIYIRLATGCNKQQSAVTASSVFHLVDSHCRMENKRSDYRVSMSDIVKFVSGKSGNPAIRTRSNSLTKIMAKGNKYMNAITNVLHWRRGSGKSFDLSTGGDAKIEFTKSRGEYIERVEKLEKLLIDGRMLYMISDARGYDNNDRLKNGEGIVVRPDPLELTLSAVDMLYSRLQELMSEFKEAHSSMVESFEVTLKMKWMLQPTKSLIPKEYQDIVDLCEKSMKDCASLLDFIDTHAEEWKDLHTVSFKSYQPIQDLMKLKMNLDQELETLHLLDLTEKNYLAWHDFNDRYFQSYCKSTKWAWLGSEDIHSNSEKSAVPNAEMTSMA